MKLIPTAAYIRVSTQEQKMHGISLDAQRDKLREYAKSHHLRIVAWYEDEGISGRKLIRNRPALQRMITESQSGAFEHIIFIKLDRFFRSVAEYHECMKALKSVTWAATEEKYDLSTANGRAFVNMKLTIAELEADQTGERIRLVNDYKVKTGQPLCGSLPWSHKIIKTDKGKRIVVNEEVRDQCLDLINHYLTGGVLRQTYMYSRQYHSFYDMRGLKKWLSNEMLCGRYRGNQDYCEALIDEETFELIQTRLQSTVWRRKTNVYLFSGLIKCPVCGRSLYGFVSRQVKNGKAYNYKKYKCDAYACKRGCTYGYNWSQNKIEQCLLDQLDDYITDTINVQPTQKKKSTSINADRTKEELDRLNYMFQKGRLSVADYDAQYQVLQGKLKDASANPVESTQDKLAKIREYINTGWKDVYIQLDEEHRRAFWHSFVKELHIERDKSSYTLKGITLL